jgi:hypothetical protein
MTFDDRRIPMKTLIRLTVTLLVVSATSICCAEAVWDRESGLWSCRVPDGRIYAKNGTVHVYNIGAAGGQHGSTSHAVICIAPGSETVQWSWPGKRNISITFKSITQGSDGVCQSSAQPFKNAPGNSGAAAVLTSDVALAAYSGCVYELTPSASALAVADPHVIIKGYDPEGDLIKKLKDLQDEIKKLKESVQQLEQDLSKRR